MREWEKLTWINAKFLFKVKNLSQESWRAFSEGSLSLSWLNAFFLFVSVVNIFDVILVFYEMKKEVLHNHLMEEAENIEVLRRNDERMSFLRPQY